MTALSGLLDELMGKNRNAAPDEKRNELHWSDEEVCKHYLSGFCPSELFTNTRSDLGACDKTHDEQTRKNYEKSSRYMKMGYEEEFLRFLQQCWQDVERRIRRNHQRLQLSEQKNQQKQPVQSSENEEKIQVLNERITEMLENIEKLGSEGEVEQAQSIMKLCDQLKEEREQLQSQKGGIMDTFAVQEKQMEVCEVCGAFLIVGDAQSRVDDHLMGKQHMGYAKIKTAIVELKERLTLAAVSKRDKREDNNRNTEPNRSPRDRDNRDERTRDRDRKSRDGGRASRDRDRRTRDDRVRSSRDTNRRQSRDRRSSKDRDRRRSRDRERRRSPDRRSSRDVNRRRSRERKSSRDRDRKSSRDRKDEKRRHERSRSRDHKRSKRSSSRDKKSHKSSKSEKSSENTHRGKSIEKEEKIENNHNDNSVSDLKVSIEIKVSKLERNNASVDMFDDENSTDVGERSIADGSDCKRLEGESGSD